MATPRDRIDAELEQIERALKDLLPVAACEALSRVETAGVAAILASFYNGIENIVKQVLHSRSLPLPTGPSWHRDLLDLAKANGILSPDVVTDIAEYMAFRHFVSHSYLFGLDRTRIASFVARAPGLLRRIRGDVDRALPT